MVSVLPDITLSVPVKMAFSFLRQALMMMETSHMLASLVTIGLPTFLRRI